LPLMAFSVWFYVAALVARSSDSQLHSRRRGFAPGRVARRALRLFRWAILWYGRIICALSFPVVRIRFQDDEPRER